MSATFVVLPAAASAATFGLIALPVGPLSATLGSFASGISSGALARPTATSAIKDVLFRSPRFPRRFAEALALTGSFDLCIVAVVAGAASAKVAVPPAAGGASTSSTVAPIVDSGGPPLL